MLRQTQSNPMLRQIFVIVMGVGALLLVGLGVSRLASKHEQNKTLEEFLQGSGKLTLVRLEINGQSEGKLKHVVLINSNALAYLSDSFRAAARGFEGGPVFDTK